MNISEIAKELTREEFENHLVIENEELKFIFNNVEICCPNEIVGLSCFESGDCDNNPITCKQCFLESIKNTKFKGEDKVELNKDNIHEVAANMTKEGFIKELQDTDYCPDKYGLTKNCQNSDSCSGCCKESVEKSDLIFKDTEVVEETKELKLDEWLTDKTKTLTKEEFLANSGYTRGSGCPRTHKLDDTYSLAGSCGGISCKDCWEQTIERNNIKFKEDTPQSTEEPSKIEFLPGKISVTLTKTDNTIFDTAAAFLMVKDPNIKCKRVSDGLILQQKNNKYQWESGHKFLALDDEWMLYKEPKDIEVSFEEAMAAFYDGKTIVSFVDDISSTYKPNDRTNEIIDTEKYALSTVEIFNGKWFIKGGQE